MVSVMIKKKKCTYEDYLKIPDDKRCELINGELLMTPSPTPRHQQITGKLEFILRAFVTEKNFGEIFDAPCDIYLDNENVVQPDILFISKGKSGIIGEKNIQGAPDLVIEIISESSVYRDMVQKKRLYAKFGIKEYWIGLPGEEEIEVHILKDNTYQLYHTYKKTDILESPYLKGLRIELKEIF